MKIELDSENVEGGKCSCNYETFLNNVGLLINQKTLQYMSKSVQIIKSTYKMVAKKIKLRNFLEALRLTSWEISLFRRIRI